MSNVDYVTVAGTADGQIVADIVGRLTSSQVGFGGNRWIVLPADERAQLTIYRDPDNNTGWIVTIYYAGDLSMRRKIAQIVYDGLVSETAWSLEWDSDDSEDIIATRMKPAA